MCVLIGIFPLANIRQSHASGAKIRDQQFNYRKIETEDRMKGKLKKKSEMTSEDWTKVREARALSLEEARKKLNTGIEDLVRSGRWKEYLQFCSRFHRYTFFNTILILLQCPTATHVAGIRTWNSMGRYVNPGEHGLEIFVPIFAKVKRSRDQDQEVLASGNDIQVIPVESDTGYQDDSAGKTLVGFKIGKVFDVSQTTGDPLPVSIVSLLQGDDSGLLQALHAFAIFKGLDVAEFPGLFGANGVCVYSPAGKAIKIGLLESLPLAQKAKTLAHELGHAALHSKQEYHSHAMNSIQELEAESCAYMVLSHFGIDSGAYSFGYLVGWAGGEQAIELIKEHGERIYKTAFEIITWIEETFDPPEDGIPVEIPITEDVDQTAVLQA
jgi:hypothetical protein